MEKIICEYFFLYSFSSKEKKCQKYSKKLKRQKSVFMATATVTLQKMDHSSEEQNVQLHA